MAPNDSHRASLYAQIKGATVCSTVEGLNEKIEFWSCIMRSRALVIPVVASLTLKIDLAKV